MNAVYRRAPITALGNGILYRAIITLPRHMAERDQWAAERIVFFETSSSDSCAEYLEKLIALAWCTDTTSWCADGYIYNVRSAYDMKRGAFGDDDDELYLFEIGAGGHGLPGVGAKRIHYARATDFDLLVPPRVATRMRELSEKIESMYAREYGAIK